MLQRYDTYIRLVNGNSKYEGIVEVFYNNKWGAVCDENWSTNKTAEIICRMLGYKQNGAVLVPASRFPPGQSNSFWLDDVTCVGNETSLFDCNHKPWGEHSCLPRQEAAVSCKPDAVENDDFIFLLDTKLRSFIRMSLLTNTYSIVPLDSVYSPACFDYDAEHNRMYFFDQQNWQLISISPDGNELRLLKQMDFNSQVYNIKVDPQSAVLIYSDVGLDAIFSMDINGQNIKSIYNYQYSPRGIALDLKSNGLGTIESMTNYDDRKVILRDSLHHLTSLDLYDDDIYFTAVDFRYPMRVHKDGTDLAIVGTQNFGQLSEIKVVRFNANHTNPSTPLNDSLASLNGVVCSGFERHLRDCDLSSSKPDVSSCPKSHNVGVICQTANQPGGSVNGMAIDLRRSMIFYSDTLNRYIVQQATNNGFTSTYAVSTDQLRSLAVDKNTGEVYYASGGLHPRIEKFKYIGPNTTSVLITNAIVNPFGIAIDYKAKLLYFCDAGTHTIEVMNTDGTNRKVLFTDFSSQLSGLSITSQYIFYTDLNKRHIMRLNRDGSSHTSIGPADFPNLKYIYAHELSFLSQ
ncbi:hypothetical protein Btru_052120 [Bulinus truncatus]|nr:hypothetical protein Btru_052120 [Bulinus truncatus]